MEISDWITLAAVIVALALGISSIKQTQRLQKRERSVRAAEELRIWSEESLKLFYLPYDFNKEQIYSGLGELTSKSVAMVAASTIVGHEFFNIATKAEKALNNYYKAIQAKRTESKKLMTLLLKNFRLPLLAYNFI